MEYGESTGFNDGKNTDFWIGKGKPWSRRTSHSRRRANMKSKPSIARRWQPAARDNGGPGYRRDYWPGYYAAFVYDLDGHNIEAVWYDYDAEGAAEGE